MARKRAIVPPKKSAMTPAQKRQTASTADAPTPRHSTRPTRGTAAHPPVYTEADSSDDEDHQPVPTKGKAKASSQPKQDNHTEGPPAPRYNTRYKQAQLSEASQDAASDGDDVEGFSRGDAYPLYKDDLPNAFNGAVDPSLDFISKAPNEVIDNVLSYLVLDQDPESGVKAKAGNHNPVVYHVLLSMAAMSRLFYHATESFAQRYRTKHKLDAPKDWSQHPWMMDKLKADEEAERNKRRSARIANTPKPETHDFYRKELLSELRSKCAICLTSGWRPGKLANQVTICEGCERSVFGLITNLTDALKRFDLRDYMLIKSRKPGPRAKFLDLPTISYGSEYKPVGFPAFKSVCIYYFRRSDVEMLAKLVHGDVEKHLQQKDAERELRSGRARTKRVRGFKINWHQEQLDTATGAVAKRHLKELRALLALNPNNGEDDDDDGFGCHGHFCYHQIGLCEECGDVPGYSRDWCYLCESVWMDRRYEQYFSRA